MAHAHIGDVDTAFEATIVDQDGAVVPIPTATTREIIFRKPDKSTITRTAVLVTDGLDGKMQYLTVADDLDEPGLWHWQGKVVIGAGTWHSDEDHFTVLRNLG